MPKLKFYDCMSKGNVDFHVILPTVSDSMVLVETFLKDSVMFQA